MHLLQRAQHAAAHATASQRSPHLLSAPPAHRAPIVLLPPQGPKRHTCVAAEKQDGSSPNGASPEAQATLSAIASTSSKSGQASKQDRGVADLAKGMLLGDKETAEQLKRYEDALARLEANKAAAAELDKIFADAGREVAIQEAQQQAGTNAEAKQIMAEAEVAAAQKMLEAAELEMAAARSGQLEANQGAERKETLKAGLAAASGGLVFSLPLLLSSSPGSSTELLSTSLGLAATAASCFLFGVTYRYIVRYDISNTQLKGGAVGAFGLVRAGAAADVLQFTSSAGPLDLNTVVGPAALYAGESMLLFTFAAAVVEKAFDLGLVRRFGIDPAAPSS